MKIHVKLIIFMLVLVTLFAFTSCNKLNSDDEINLVSPDADYRIVKDGDDYYLTFADESKYSSENGARLAPSLTFKSVEEMKDKILNDKLSEEEKAVMSRFSKDENGKTKILNFSRLYNASVPEGMNVTNVRWAGGERYVMQIESSNGLVVVWFYVHTKESYQSAVAKKHDSLTEYDDLSITKVSDRNATEYVYKTSTATCKTVSYTLEKGDVQLLIDETYVLEFAGDSIEPSYDVPFDIRVYGTYGEERFEIYILGLSERPSVEWLSSFGLLKVE